MKNYLLAYNWLLFLGWLAFLLYGFITGFQLDRFSLILLNICQGAALLEILHTGMRWVSSPVVTTALQVSSRIFILVLINFIPEAEYIEVMGLNGVQMVWIAWGITEIVRYSFYGLGLLGKEQKWLTTLRYTLFLGLYPLGVLGELLILWTLIKINGYEINLINGILFLIFLSYFIFFPQMFGHMLKQRRKKLSGS